MPRIVNHFTDANVIAVASITSTGAISSFSNWGATTIDPVATTSLRGKVLSNGRLNVSGF